MYNWTSNQTVLILKTEWVVCTIGVPYKQYFAKMIKSTACIFCIGHQKSKSSYYVHLWYMFSWCAKKNTFYLENCRKINRATVTSRAFQAAELCRKGPRGYDWWEDTSMQKGQPFDIRPRFLTISITRFFFLKTRW